jgi:tetratricopeptide (TPR) repeat protein
MPKRPKQHQLEDESRITFQESLPRVWVFRDKSHDYGIDGEVEIFNDNEQSTGLLFYVQLKATAERNGRKARTISLSVEHINYLKSLSIPTLLVRYTQHDRRLFAQWIHGIPSIRSEQKYRRILFSAKDRWDKSAAINVISELKTERFIARKTSHDQIPIHLGWSGTAVPFPKFASIEPLIRMRLGWLPGCFEITANHYEAVIQVIVDDEGIVAKIGSFVKYSTSFAVDCSEQMARDIAADNTMMAIGAALSLADQNEIASKIFQKFSSNALVTLDQRMSLIVARSFCRTHRYSEALSLCVTLLGNSHAAEAIEILQNTILANSDHLSDHEYQNLVSFLKNRLTRLQNSRNRIEITVAQYNLAAALRHVPRSSSNSLFHYKKACEAFPQLRNSAQFLSEIGELCLARSKFKIATKIFKQAVTLEDRSQDQYYLADSLFLSGNYSKARRALHDLLKKQEMGRSEYCLKYVSWKAVIDFTGEHSQLRNPDAAYQLFGDKKPQTSAELNNACREIFNIDACIPELWEALAFSAAEENKDDAVLYFLVAASLARHRPINWVNAILCTIQMNRGLAAIPLMIDAAFRLNGEEFVSALQAATQHFSNKFRSELWGFFDSVIRQIPRTEIRPLVHLFDVQKKPARFVPAVEPSISAPDFKSLYGSSLVGRRRLEVALSIGDLSKKFVKLNHEVVTRIEDHLALFKEKFGRDPAPNDPLFFDPDAPSPRPFSIKKLHRETIEAMRKAQIPEHHIFVFDKTGFILTEENYDKLTPEEQDEVESAYAEYFEKKKGKNNKLPRKHL